LFAVFYCEDGNDVYGWHLETRGAYFSAAFFMVEHFYGSAESRLYRSVDDDVYGPWTIDAPPSPNLIRCPLPEAACHALEQYQSRFIEEWLELADDGNALLGERASVKAHRLNRMHREGDVWSHMSPGADPNVARLLRRYWRLNEKLGASIGRSFPH
jgi:hypothetical protein